MYTKYHGSVEGKQSEDKCYEVQYITGRVKQFFFIALFD